jgi:hypothetical protein
METGCVFFAVRTECLISILMSFVLQSVNPTQTLSGGGGSSDRLVGICSIRNVRNWKLPQVCWFTCWNVVSWELFAWFWNGNCLQLRVVCSRELQFSEHGSDLTCSTCWWQLHVLRTLEHRASCSMTFRMRTEQRELKIFRAIGLSFVQRSPKLQSAE